MVKQAWLGVVSPARSIIASRLRSLITHFPAWCISAIRIGQRLLSISQPWRWRFALLPIAVAVSILIAEGRPISWGLAGAESLSVICALSGWGTLRAYKPLPQGDIPYLGLGAGLITAATLAGIALFATATAPTVTFGVIGLALIALDLSPASFRDRLPRVAMIIARRVVTPALLGFGLVMLTALAQQARPDTTLWLLGAALSLLAYAAIQARAMTVDGAIPDEKAPWRRPIIPLAGALAAAGTLVIVAALPRSAPHGLLLALVGLPLALVAVTGFWRSTFVPARTWAARRMGDVFALVALALIAGALASALAAAAGSALTQALGG